MGFRFGFITVPPVRPFLIHRHIPEKTEGPYKSGGAEDANKKISLSTDNCYNTIVSVTCVVSSSHLLVDTGHFRQRKIEGSPLSLFRFHPHLSTVVVDNLLNN